jgi:ligand-binding SRPBCC domain-containing protein
MIYQLVKEQFLEANIDEVWDFVSSPKNLKKITPEQMNFIITSNNLASKMYPGMIITYKVSPIFKIPMNWVTEITHMQKNKYFVDEQRVGPYKIWHHQHLFEIKDNGVLMTDIISYKLPLGLLGNLVHRLFIKKQLESIFSFRFDKMNQIFNNRKS